MIRPVVLVLSLAVAAGCASSRPTTHGTITTLSAATSADSPRCEHKVPQEVCTRCNPALVPKFKAAKDWCVEHDGARVAVLRVPSRPDLRSAAAPAAERGPGRAVEGGRGRARRWRPTRCRAR